MRPYAMIGAFSPLERAARRSPHALAVAGPRRRLSYAEYFHEARRAAAGLRARGMKGGDVVGVIAAPSEELLALLMGCFEAGVIACCVNTRLPGAEKRRFLEQAGALLLITDEPALDAGLTAFAPEEIFAKEPGAGGVFEPEQGATVIFTSGSSAAPKPALHRYSNHYENARASNRNILLGAGGAWLLSLPLYHVAGFGVLFRCLAAGAAVVVPAADEEIGAAIERGGVTHVSLVHTQLYRLLRREADVARLRRLDAILLGGGAMPAALLEESVREGLRIHTSYGLTEMSSQAATTPAGADLEELQTVGRPLIESSVRVAPDGAIQVRGPTLFRGYLEQGRLRLPLTPDGWFDTGDTGAWDERGRLRVLGRRDSMFTCAGENIQPEEIEARLMALPDVADAVVAPKADAEYGAVPVAFVRMRAGAKMAPDLLRGELAKSLPKLKIPRLFLPWPDEAPWAGLKAPRAMFRALAAEAAQGAVAQAER